MDLVSVNYVPLSTISIVHLLIHIWDQLWGGNFSWDNFRRLSFARNVVNFFIRWSLTQSVVWLEAAQINMCGRKSSQILPASFLAHQPLDQDWTLSHFVGASEWAERVSQHYATNSASSLLETPEAKPSQTFVELHTCDDTNVSLEERKKFGKWNENGSFYTTQLSVFTNQHGGVREVEVHPIHRSSFNQWIQDPLWIIHFTVMAVERKRSNRETSSSLFCSFVTCLQFRTSASLATAVCLLLFKFNERVGAWMDGRVSES